MPPRNLLQSFTTWASGKPDVEPDVAETMVDLKANYLGDPQPGRWRSGNLSEVLLELIPRKVTADDEWYAHVVPTARSFIRFAATKGALHQHSAPLRDLLAELADVEAQFDDAVHDSSRYGMAKSIFSSLGVDDATGLDENALQALVADFNALPEAERKAITDPGLARLAPEPPGNAGSLPAVRLAPQAELSEAVFESLLVAAVVDLAEWLGSGCKVTQTGLPTIAESRSLVAALGWELPDEHFRAIRSARDISGLQLLWALADAVGVIEIGSTRALPGLSRDAALALRQSEPEQALAWWHQLLVALLTATVEGDDYEPLPFEEGIGPIIRHAMISAYEDDVHTLSQLVDELVDVGDRDDPDFDEDDDTLPVGPLGRDDILLQIVEGTLSSRLQPFVDLGAIQPLDGEPDPEILLTPLGVYGVRAVALAEGRHAPLARDVHDLEVAEAVHEIRQAGPELFRQLAGEWFAAHPDDALDQLLGLAENASAADRYAVLTILDGELDGVDSVLPRLAGRTLLELVTRAFDAEREALVRVATAMFTDDGELSPELAGVSPEQLVASVTAFGWMSMELSPAERSLMVVESFARELHGAEPPVRTPDLRQSVWTMVAEADLPGVIDGGHPEALVVLEAVSTGHPEGRVRRAAKKAAYKLRTRLTG